MKGIWGIALVICVGLVGIGILNMTGQAEAELTVSVPGDVTEADKIMIDGAVKVLAAECPRFKNAWIDIVAAKGDIVGSWLAENMEADVTRGWGRTVELVVTIRDEETSYIPNSQRAWGHSLQFIMGGGERPGIRVTKSQAGWLCMMQEDEFFKDIPALAFIK